MEKQHFFDKLMYHSLTHSHNIEFMIWHFVWFFRACAEPLIMIGIHAQEAVQTVRPYYLQNTQHFGWAGITAIPLRSLFSVNIYCSYQMCFSFKISSAPKGTFLWDEIYSLPYSLLLDYSTLRSLPYPTLPEVEKPLLVGAWRGVP